MDGQIALAGVVEHCVGDIGQDKKVVVQDAVAGRRGVGTQDDGVGCVEEERSEAAQRQDTGGSGVIDVGLGDIEDMDVDGVGNDGMTIVVGDSFDDVGSAHGGVGIGEDVGRGGQDSAVGAEDAKAVDVEIVEREGYVVASTVIGVHVEEQLRVGGVVGEVGVGGAAGAVGFNDG